ncbi:C45 family autoproteolytic acyltransferase/hydrolase [Plastorhodobacter daqingensis]|uniref:C45 family autoproteolytic acyltransferase/hydrolase n=1 Tax=Plastorhodobacter daqingensis TaxID=1387281 RepID=A0ABW2UR20_9RHOB
MIEISAHGTPRMRGVAQQGAADRQLVARATVGRVELARADGLIDADAEAYLAAQRRFHEEHDPESLDELAGIAEAHGLSEADLFAHLHLGTLRDMKGGGVLIEGCSAIAVAQGPEGPMVLKNRDFSGLHLGIQCVLRHSGPDIATGSVLSLGSLGSLAAWSSGINAAGLAVADTQVAVNRHRVGWLRYFLLPRLLARARTVPQALALIRSLPHAGGGTLVLADRSGATAGVELSAAGPVIEEGGLQWRTNHFRHPLVQDETLESDDDRIAGTSHSRHDYLSRILPTRSWTVASGKALLSAHPDPEGAPVCQHGDGGAGSETISSVIYSCSLGAMEISEGTPCLGRWQAVAPCR